MHIYDKKKSIFLCNKTTKLYRYDETNKTVVINNNNAKKKSIISQV